MGSLVIVDNDELKIVPSFAAHIVVIPPAVKITAGGKATIGGKKVCIVGDELKVVLNTTYTTLAHTVPGNGIVTIELAASQKAKGASDDGTSLITMGTTFIAKFAVTAPAQLPPPVSTPDTVLTSQSTGVFTPSQTFVTAD